MFVGIPLVIVCIVDSLNLLGIPGFLLAGFMGTSVTQIWGPSGPAKHCKFTPLKGLPS